MSGLESADLGLNIHLDSFTNQTGDVLFIREDANLLGFLFTSFPWEPNIGLCLLPLNFCVIGFSERRQKLFSSFLDNRIVHNKSNEVRYSRSVLQQLTLFTNLAVF